MLGYRRGTREKQVVKSQPRKIGASLRPTGDDGDFFLIKFLGKTHGHGRRGSRRIFAGFNHAAITR